MIWVCFKVSHTTLLILLIWTWARRCFWLLNMMMHINNKTQVGNLMCIVAHNFCTTHNLPCIIDFIELKTLVWMFTMCINGNLVWYALVIFWLNVRFHPWSLYVSSMLSWTCTFVEYWPKNLFTDLLWFFCPKIFELCQSEMSLGKIITKGLWTNF